MIRARVILALVLALAPSALRAQSGEANALGSCLAAAALERTRHHVVYDGSYVRIPYPGGDVPADRGVCTDVVIRAYRALRIDLQREVHEEMRADFDAFPKRWGLSKPDPNIDHRRVPNLQAFFARRGQSLAPSRAAADYRPGDLVTWDLANELPHIGIVSARRSERGERPLIVHNIGAGPVLADVLFAWPITGHYRYRGPDPEAALRTCSRSGSGGTGRSSSGP